PEEAKDADDLRKKLIAALKEAPKEDAAARELLTNLTDRTRTARAHREAASAYLAACVKAAGSRDVVIDWLKVAAQRRAEMEAARQPQGMITEPGFRLIFPVIDEAPKAGELRLDAKSAKAVKVER